VKLYKAIDDIGKSEMELASQLAQLAEHHAAEHDVFHLGHRLANECAERVRKLDPFVERYDARHVDTDEIGSPGFLAALRQKASEMMGRVDVVGLVLLEELREVYLAAQRVELDWIILHQAAMAVRDRELLEVQTECHEQAEVVGKWLRTRIKVATAQVLATS
jgi:hypothetical protein